MPMTTLTDLRSRVLAGSGEDRELEILISGAMGYRSRFTGQLLSESLEDPDRRAEAMRWEGPPPLMRSLDACIALVESKLPGWLITLRQYEAGWDVELSGRIRARGTVKSPGFVTFKHAHAERYRAMIAALLTALMERGHAPAE